MRGEISRRLKPEEQEMLRKREELTAIRASLAQRELELVDLRSQLAVFEGRYLRQVGSLYAELDDWKARILELQAQVDPSAAAKEQAEKAREQARQTYENAHSKASETHDFIPSPELKRLFREVAKRIHPDFATDAGDLERRTRFMVEANRAYQAGDAEALQRILDEYHDGADVVGGEGIGAELIRIIRQISQARNRLSAIEQELATLRQSEIAQLMQRVENEQELGRDLLAGLAIAVQEQIQQVKKEYQDLAQQEVKRA